MSRKLHLAQANIGNIGSTNDPHAPGEGTDLSVVQGLAAGKIEDSRESVHIVASSQSAKTFSRLRCAVGLHIPTAGSCPQTWEVADGRSKLKNTIRTMSEDATLSSRRGSVRARDRCAQWLEFFVSRNIGSRPP